MKNRLKQPFGLLINTEETVNFSFEGKNYQGYQGDSIASALWANEQKILSRSFKYHRPRGVLSMTGQDGNTLVQLDEGGNIAADNYEISQNLVVKGQHYWGSLTNDKLKFIGKLSRFLPVAFYYKAFYRNDSWNKKWAKIFRKFTGLGVINTQKSNKTYDKQYLFYDAVVVGAGLAGLKTALALSAQDNIKILLLDENKQFGGGLNYMRCQADDTQRQTLKKELLDAIDKKANINQMRETICNGVYGDNWLSIIKGNRLYKTRAKQLFICTGRFQQPLVFHNNDLPGIMLSSAAQRLIKLYAVKPGQKAVIATVSDAGYGAALDLLDAGVDIKAIVDLREDSQTNNDLLTAVKKQNIRIIHRHTVYAAKANKKQQTLNAVEIRPIVADGQCSAQSEIIDCDLLCVDAGHMPAYQLPCFLGATLSYDNQTGFIIENLAKNCHLVGSISQVCSLENITKQANAKSQQATQLLAGTHSNENSDITWQSQMQTFVLPIFKHPKAKEFIDFDEDLQICDIINSVREGYEHIQLVKRFSTLGMGPSQGRFSAFMSAYLVASLDKNRSIDKVGVTTARPPYTVEKIGHQAGRSFYPEKHSAMHHRHLEAGAQLLLAGAWMRPAYYGKKGDVLNCVREESLAVRQNVGIVDVSTLGGIEIRGADASEFINRVYTWSFLKQAVGKARYALLTNELGVVIDDGVACRFHEQHYYVTATTGGVDNVYLQFLKWNAMWRLDVDIANVTSAWCGVNIAGPKSRQVLETICQDVDLSAEAFPYIGVRQGTVAEIPARLIRVGFVGELGYEIHVPQHQGEALWDALMLAGKAFNIRPFGIETQRLLRLEKGHVIISQDTDAMTTPAEINMSWAVAAQKPFFVGQKSIAIQNSKPAIRQLIGFELTEHNNTDIVKESHLCFDDKQQLIGRITSCTPSAILNKVIGMAYVKPEFSQNGQVFLIRWADKKYLQAKVVPMPFYDPENKRQEM